MDKENALLSSGLFEIDSDGNIWRVAKRHGRGVKPGGGYHLGATTSPCQRVRAEYRQRQGYLLVAATIDGKRVVTGAHRLAWANFNGRIPPGMTINHKNGVKDDNRPSNLELATYSQQRIHALTVLGARHWDCKGRHHPKTRLVESDVLEIRRRRSAGEMVKSIAADYKMNPKAISAICRRRTWRHV